MFGGYGYSMPENPNPSTVKKSLTDLSLLDYDLKPGERPMSDVTDESIRLIIRVPKLGAIVLRATESDETGHVLFEGVSIFTDEEIKYARI